MTTENNSVVPIDAEGMSILAGLGSMGVDLAALAAQVEEQSKFEGSGGQGAGYDTRHMAKVEISKDSGGRFNLTNPYDGEFISAKSLFITIVDQNYTLERWKKQGEVIEGLDMAKFEKRPICQVSHYVKPDGAQSENGWFKVPALSAYHATKMALPELTGTNGPFGKDPGMKCVDCPLAKQGLASGEKLCKPTGTLEIIVHATEKGPLKPISAFIRLPLTSLMRLVDEFEGAKKRFGDQLVKKFGFFTPGLMSWRMDASVDTNDGNKWGVATLIAVGILSTDLVKAGVEAKEATSKILLDAIAAKRQDPTGGGYRAPAASTNSAPAATPSGFGGTIDVASVTVPPPLDSGLPF